MPSPKDRNCPTLPVAVGSVRPTTALRHAVTAAAAFEGQRSSSRSYWPAKEVRPCEIRVSLVDAFLRLGRVLRSSDVNCCPEKHSRYMPRCSIAEVRTESMSPMFDTAVCVALVAADRVCLVDATGSSLRKIALESYPESEVLGPEGDWGEGHSISAVSWRPRSERS